jgi:hypothetical protein
MVAYLLEELELVFELSNQPPTRTRIEYAQNLMKMNDKLNDINVVSTKEGIIE